MHRVTDATNPNRLVPIGSVGELVIEGPILAQAYLKNATKTTEVFIENPTWTLEGLKPHSSTRRMYRTGKP